MTEQNDMTEQKMNSVHLQKKGKFAISALAVIFYTDFSVMAGRYSNNYDTDWIGAILASFLAFFLLVVTEKLKPVKEIKFCKSLESIFVCAVSIIFLGVSLLTFCNFVVTCVVPEIKAALLFIAIVITALYSARKRFTVLLAATRIIAPILIFFLALCLLLLCNQIKISNISVDISNANIINITAISTIVFYIKGLLLKYLFRNDDTQYTGENKINFILNISVIFTALIMMLIMIITLSALGKGLYESLEYPFYYPLSLTHFGDYFERADIISVVISMSILTLKAGIFMRIAWCAISDLSNIFKSKKPVH